MKIKKLNSKVPLQPKEILLRLDTAAVVVPRMGDIPEKIVVPLIVDRPEGIRVPDEGPGPVARGDRTVVHRLTREIVLVRPYQVLPDLLIPLVARYQ